MDARVVTSGADLEEVRSLFREYSRMVLDTLPAMGAAQRLYERLVFHDVAPYRFNLVPGTRFMALELREDAPG